MSLVVFLAACPLSFWFACGVAAYGRDDAHMMSMGLRPSASAFVDTVTRLPIASGGCLIHGNEWVSHGPYNAALILMTRALGPAPGTYDGPIPTEADARRTLETASPLGWRALATDAVTVDGHEVTLQRWLGPALVHGCYYFDPLDADENREFAPDDGLIRAAIWRDRVLLIELGSRYPSMFDDEPAHVSLVDARSGRLFGHFAGSCPGHNFPLPGREVGPRLLDMDYAQRPPPLFR